MKRKSAILDMYNITRGNYTCVPDTEDEKRILSDLVVYEENLRKRLSENPEILELYEKVYGKQMDINVCSNESSFVEGFRFGFLMAMDVFEC